MQRTVTDYCRNFANTFTHRANMKMQTCLLELSITVVWSEIRPVIPLQTQW